MARGRLMGKTKNGFVVGRRALVHGWWRAYHFFCQLPLASCISYQIAVLGATIFRVSDGKKISCIFLEEAHPRGFPAIPGVRRSLRRSDFPTRPRSAKAGLKAFLQKWCGRRLVLSMGLVDVSFFILRPIAAIAWDGAIKSCLVGGDHHLQRWFGRRLPGFFFNKLQAAHARHFFMSGFKDNGNGKNYGLTRSRPSAAVAGAVSGAVAPGRKISSLPGRFLRSLAFVFNKFRTFFFVDSYVLGDCKPIIFEAFLQFPCKG